MKEKKPLKTVNISISAARSQQFEEYRGTFSPTEIFWKAFDLLLAGKLEAVNVNRPTISKSEEDQLLALAVEVEKKLEAYEMSQAELRVEMNKVVAASLSVVNKFEARVQNLEKSVSQIKNLQKK